MMFDTLFTKAVCILLLLQRIKVVFYLLQSIGKNIELDYEKTLIDKYEKARSLNKNIQLLVISDTHCNLIFSNEIKEAILNNDYDLCCVLGDVSDNDYTTILQYIPKEKIVALLGNHDRFDLLDRYGITNINGKVIEVNGVRIGGIQGSFKYKKEYFPSFTHEESIQFLNNMPYVDILLSHDKPFTIDNDDIVHDGLKGITRYLYINRIPMNIHGHIHNSYISTLQNGTLVKGVYGCEIVKGMEFKNN